MNKLSLIFTLIIFISPLQGNSSYEDIYDQDPPNRPPRYFTTFDQMPGYFAPRSPEEQGRRNEELRQMVEFVNKRAKAHANAQPITNKTNVHEN